MIEYLRGRARAVGENSLVVDVGGVGVRALCSMVTMNHFADTDEAVVVYTRLVMRENHPPELFGFLSEEERQVFDQLCEVKGVSGRIALNLLSRLSSAGVVAAISEQDDARLQTASGVGRRLAERIVVELRDRILHQPLSETSQASTAGTSLAHDAIAGLVSLGYKNNQARAAVVGYMRKNPATTSAADIIQSVLRKR